MFPLSRGRLEKENSAMQCVVTENKMRDLGRKMVVVHVQEVVNGEMRRSMPGSLYEDLEII